jgi:hypothetical protein
MNILDLVGKETRLTFGKATAQEYDTPCPFWPAQGRFWRRQCNQSGDAVHFVRAYRGMSLVEALSLLCENQQYVDVIDTNQRLQAGAPSPIRIIRIINIIYIIYIIHINKRVPISGR